MVRQLQPSGMRAIGEGTALVKFLTVRQTFDPLSVLRQRLQEHLSRLLDSEIESRAIDSRSAGYFPLMNLTETADMYIVVAEVPGVRSENLNIDLSEEGLTIDCRRTLEDGGKEESFRRQERWHGSARRELSFPKRVRPDDATAELHAGVLSIRVPKAEPSQRRRIDVTTKQGEG